MSFDGLCEQLQRWAARLESSQGADEKRRQKKKKKKKKKKHLPSPG